MEWSLSNLRFALSGTLLMGSDGGGNPAFTAAV